MIGEEDAIPLSEREFSELVRLANRDRFLAVGFGCGGGVWLNSTCRWAVELVEKWRAGDSSGL